MQILSGKYKTKQNETQSTSHLTSFVAFAEWGWRGFKSINKVFVKQKVYTNCWS